MSKLAKQLQINYDMLLLKIGNQWSEDSKGVGHFCQNALFLSLDASSTGARLILPFCRAGLVLTSLAPTHKMLIELPSDNQNIPIYFQKVP